MIISFKLIFFFFPHSALIPAQIKLIRRVLNVMNVMIIVLIALNLQVIVQVALIRRFYSIFK
jgi:hypothetical protein